MLIFDRNGIQLHQGHAPDVLRTLPDESVQCVVTSPPYYRLRAYDTDPQVWGGDPACAHDWQSVQRYSAGASSQASSAAAYSEAGEENAERVRLARWSEQTTCARCGAWRGELGQEERPDCTPYMKGCGNCYTCHLVGVFADVRRVLREDGTLWLNIGDCYAGAGYSNHTGTGGARRENGGRQRHNIVPGARTKSLLGVPWRVAFALVDNGWLLRSCIVWHKLRAMYEPVKDRPTTEHEYVFLLAKSGTYFYDWEAIAVPKVNDPLEIKNRGTVWAIPVEASRGAHNATMPLELARRCVVAGSEPGDTILDPFGGVGTTALAAWLHTRDAISIELNTEYNQMAQILFETRV